MAECGFDSHPTLEKLLSRKRGRKLLNMAWITAITLIILWYTKSLYLEETNWDRIGGWAGMITMLLRYLPPDVTTFPDLIEPAIETLMIAFLGTLLAAFFSLPTVWLAARNITPLFPASYSVGRLLIIVSRSVHEIVWALLFVTAFGLGSLTGIIAIAFRSFGFLSKLVAEAIEDIDPRSLEGIKATGANRLQVIHFGVLPQIMPIFIGNLIFLLDINIRRSTILGMVGAGGLGLVLRDEMFQFNFGGATTVLLVIVVIVATGEMLSLLTRKAITKT